MIVELYYIGCTAAGDTLDTTFLFKVSFPHNTFSLPKLCKNRKQSK